MDEFRYHVECLRNAYRSMQDEALQVECLELVKELTREMNSTLLRQRLEHNVSRTVTEEAEWLIQETYGSEWSQVENCTGNAAIPTRELLSPPLYEDIAYGDLLSALYDVTPVNNTDGILNDFGFDVTTEQSAPFPEHEDAETQNFEKTNGESSNFTPSSTALQRLDSQQLYWTTAQPEEQAWSKMDQITAIPNSPKCSSEQPQTSAASEAICYAEYTKCVTGPRGSVQDPNETRNHFSTDNLTYPEESVAPVPSDMRLKTRQKRFKCAKCSKIYKTKRRLNCHKKIHFQNSIVCVICGAVLQKDSERYSIHLERRHGRPTGTDIHPLSNTNDVWKFNQKDDTPQEKENSGSFFREENNSNAGRPKTGNNTVCAECGFTATNRKQLYRHGKKFCHNTRKPGCSEALRCSLCGYTTKSKFNLLRHTQRLHSDKRTAICEYCGSYFKDIDTAKNHIRYVHENERNFKCNECGKTFVTSWNRERHIKLRHSFIRAFSCDQCGRIFQTAANVKRHKNQNCQFR